VQAASAPIVKMAEICTVTLPKCSDWPEMPMTVGNGMARLASGIPGMLPKKSRTNSCRNTEMPIAVMRGARRGASRNGR